MSNSVKVSAPVSSPAPVVAVKAPAKYAESAVITLLAPANPKRAASAKRFALYGSAVGATTTVKAYLDGCLALNPEEPRYRWRADLAWDLKRGFISIA